MRELDWSDADVVFISSICYSDNLMESIHSALCALKPLSLLITLKLFEDCEGYFNLKGQSYLQMSFGRVTVYILQRKQ